MHPMHLLDHLPSLLQGPASLRAPLALLDIANDYLRPIVSVVLIGSVAIAMLVVSLRVLERVMPFSVRHELEEDHNIAAAIVMGSVIIGVAIVIAAVARG